MNTKKLLLLICFISFPLLFTACDKEGCTDSNAENYDSKADSDDGSCILERDKFIGTFNVNESCDGYSDSYQITISESSSGTDKVNVSNLYDAGVSLPGTIDGNNIVIPSTLASSATFSGSGSINGLILTLSFNVVYGGYTASCTATCTKQ